MTATENRQTPIREGVRSLYDAREIIDSMEYQILSRRFWRSLVG